MPPASPSFLLSAVRERRFLITAWPWRGVVYAAGTAIVAGVLGIVLACPVAPIAAAVSQVGRGGSHLLAAAPLTLFGLALLAVAGPPLAVFVGRIERWRLKSADDRPTYDSRRGNLYADPATWRAFAYLLILAVVAPLWLGALALAGLFEFVLLLAPVAVHMSEGIVIGTWTLHSTGTSILLMVLGLALLPVFVYAVSVVSGAHAAVARMLLSSEPDPAAIQLVEVSRSRARMADAFEAERRRIERDLHDGAQQRLVSLNMQLGLAKLDVDDGSPAATAISSAQEQAKALMAEIRDLVHGISPRTLSELGLPAALEELAAAAPVPTTVSAPIGRLPSGIEVVAYFVAAEALTNVAKHSAAQSATVTAAIESGKLVLVISDDGRGGADPAAGSGLTGLADRVAAAGGRLLLASPPGGPTVLRIELPCG
jgi:signal transduction histidine kinase